MFYQALNLIVSLVTIARLPLLKTIGLECITKHNATSLYSIPKSSMLSYFNVKHFYLPELFYLCFYSKIIVEIRYLN